jgi:hypothetical protein
MRTIRPSLFSKKISRPLVASSSSALSTTMCEPLVPPMNFVSPPMASLVRSVQGPDALTTTSAFTTNSVPEITSRSFTPPSSTPTASR